MPKKAAFLTVHGMGRTEVHYNSEIVEETRQRLGPLFDDLHVGKVYYQDLLQPNEDRVWNRVAKRVKWDELRKFLLFGFGDAAGLESGKEPIDSDYAKAQIKIARKLFLAREAMGGDGPVLILAQSLGCQVVSNYFWDALRAAAGSAPQVGIWQDIAQVQDQIAGGPPLNVEEIAFLQGKSFRVFMTTGCNIHIFVAAHAKDDILPIRPNGQFEWHNYYDKDDVLSWPLADLSSQYADVVTDHAVNAGGGIIGWLVKSWNPMSHTQYWGDDEVLDPLESKLRSLLS
jgi:hypothetical protein